MQGLGDELQVDSQDGSQVELKDYLKVYLKESADPQAVPAEAADSDSLEMESEGTASQKES
jgi:hypothetical protein